MENLTPNFQGETFQVALVGPNVSENRFNLFQALEVAVKPLPIDAWKLHAMQHMFDPDSNAVMSTATWIFDRDFEPETADDNEKVLV